MFAYTAGSDVVSSPSFVTVSPEARLLQLAVVEEGDSIVQGPAAGDAETRARPAASEGELSRANAPGEILTTTDEQPGAEPGADREVAHPVE